MAKEAKDTVVVPQPKIKVQKKRVARIGTPGYRVVKQKDPDTSQKSLLFEIDYTEIDPTMTPKYRIMSAFEQKVEAPDNKYQYLIFAADPYDTISFKIPNAEIDRREPKFFAKWDKDKKTYTMQLYFKVLTSC